MVRDYERSRENAKAITSKPPARPPLSFPASPFCALTMGKKKSKSNGPTPPATPILSSLTAPESEVAEKQDEEDNPTSSSLGLVVQDETPPTSPIPPPPADESTELKLKPTTKPSIVDLSHSEPTDNPAASISLSTTSYPAPSSLPPPSEPTQPISTPSEPSSLPNGSSLPTAPLSELNRPSTPPPPPAPLPTAALASATSTLASLSLEPAISAASSSSPRPSLDLPRPSLDSNGHHDDSSNVRTAALEKAYDKLRAEKEALEKQYRALVGKVGTMRDTLGKKLREDAVSRCPSLHSRPSRGARRCFTRIECEDCNEL